MNTPKKNKKNLTPAGDSFWQQTPAKKSVPVNDSFFQQPAKKGEVPIEDSFLKGNQQKIHLGKNWKIGDIIGSYQIVGELGRGGMGKVYKVQDTRVQRVLALKVVLENNQRVINRFLREGETTARLQHPNIVQIYGLHFDGEIPYILMQYIEGQTLSKYLAECNLSLRQKVKLFITIAKSVEYAHSQKVLHRDIKPANIMISNEGIPYLMDFGLAKVTNVPDKSITKTGNVLGSPQYMSPEQARGEIRRLTPQTDVYSLGAILYEMLTGTPVVLGDNPMEILYQVLQEKPIPPKNVNPEISLPLNNICLNALEKDKQNRYLSVKEMCDDLEKYLHGKKISRRYKGSFLKYGIIAFVIIVSSIGILAIIPKHQFSQQRTTEIVVNDPKTIHETAQRLLAIGDFEEAEKQLQKAFAATKDKSLQQQMNITQLLLYLYSNQYQKLEDLYRAQNLQNTSHAKLIMGMRHFHGNNLDVAEKYFEEISGNITSEIQDELCYYWGRIYYERKLYERACEQFNRIQTPENFHDKSLFLYNGISHFHQNRMGQAEKWLQNSTSIEAKRYLGMIYLRKPDLRDWQKAVEYFTECCAEDPENSSLQTWLGEAYYQVKNYSQADKIYTFARNLDRNNFEALQGYVKIAYQDVSKQENRYFLGYRYIEKYQIQTPDFCDAIFEQIRSLYTQNVPKTHLQGNPSEIENKIKDFVKKLTDRSKETYYIAKEALILMRYHDKILDILQNAPTTIPAENIADVRNQIISLKKRETKTLLYKNMVDFYFHHQSQAKKYLRNHIEDIKKILENPSENSVQRYLAATTLMQLQEFEYLEQNTLRSDDISTMIICICVIKDFGFPKNDEFLKQKVDTVDDPFLKSRMIKNISEIGFEMFRKLQKNVPNSAALLAAAANLLAKNPTNSQAISSIKDFMQHSDPVWRSYAHYHFWRNQTPRQHYEIFVKATKDPHVMVQKIALSQLEKLTEKDLPLLIEASKSNHFDVKILAFRAICNIAPHHPELEKAILDRDNNFLLRFYILLKRYIRGFERGKLISCRSIITKILEDPAPYFRSAALSFLCATEISPLNLIDNEKDANIRAALILYSTFPEIMGGSLTIQEKHEIISRYLNQPHENLCKSAHMGYLYLASKDQKKQVMGNITQLKNPAAKQGVATALHYFFRDRVEGTSFDYLLKKISNTEDEQRGINVNKMIKLIQNPMIRKQLQNWLEQANSFYEFPECLYQLAIIYKHLAIDNKDYLDKARSCLEKAIAQEKDIWFLVEYTDILQQQNTNLSDDTLQDILEISSYNQGALFQWPLLQKIKSDDFSRQFLKTMCLRHREIDRKTKVTFFEALSNIYTQQRETRELATIYKKYADVFRRGSD